MYLVKYVYDDLSRLQQEGMRLLQPEEGFLQFDRFKMHQYHQNASNRFHMTWLWEWDMGVYWEFEICFVIISCYIWYYVILEYGTWVYFPSDFPHIS